MAIKCFEDVIAWQKAQDFSVFIYKSFGDLKDWDFRSQICRASVSILTILLKGLTEVQNQNLSDFCISVWLRQAKLNQSCI